MLPLIESFQKPDQVLNSCIGNYYGDIYETQLESARNSNLNKKISQEGLESFRLLPPPQKAKL